MSYRQTLLRESKVDDFVIGGTSDEHGFCLTIFTESTKLNATGPMNWDSSFCVKEIKSCCSKISTNY